MSKEKLSKDEVYHLSAALLGGWFCVHEDMAEERAVDLMWDKIKNGGTILEIPTDDKKLFKDRLFGGWQCADDPKRRHVYFAQAYYTFLGGPQTELSAKERQEIFKTLYEKNKKEQFIGSNKFMEACPMIQ